MPVDAPVRLVYILRDLILHPLPKLSVKCLDRFEVYPRLGQGGGLRMRIMRWFTLESKPLLPSKATLDGRDCWATPNLPNQRYSKPFVRLWIVIG
jgi:hypothetical protein